MAKGVDWYYMDKLAVNLSYSNIELDSFTNPTAIPDLPFNTPEDKIKGGVGLLGLSRDAEDRPHQGGDRNSLEHESSWGGDGWRHSRTLGRVSTGGGGTRRAFRVSWSSSLR